MAKESGTTIAKAYVQIMPSTSGISDEIQKSLSGESGTFEQVGSTWGNSLGKKMIGTIAALGIGKAIADTISGAISNASDYQQLTGGVETLFKNSSDTVMKYANEAYKTAGLSANQYMEQITSFSASLISSLGGDTDAAAEAGNRAIIDMSDNANKMGSSMESIQNAYQGFAKQNYTMLDNLKLGYGGTKSEMERLINDAAQMTDIQNQLNVSVEAGNLSFGNIVNAISVMQASLGIAGTTALEAGSTIQGSFNQMKAAWENLKTAIGTGLNIDTAVNNFASSFQSAMNNIVPVAVQVIPNLITAISNALPELIPVIVDGIGKAFMEAFAQIPLMFMRMNPIGQITTVVVAGFAAIKAAAQFGEAITSITNLVTSISKLAPVIATQVAATLSSAKASLLNATAKSTEAGATTMLGTASAAAAPAILAVTGEVLLFAVALAAVVAIILILTGKMDEIIWGFTAAENGIEATETGFNRFGQSLAKLTGNASEASNSVNQLATSTIASSKNADEFIEKYNSASQAASQAASSFNSLEQSTSSVTKSGSNLQIGWSSIADVLRTDANGIVREHQKLYEDLDDAKNYVEMSSNAFQNAMHSLTPEARKAADEAFQIMNEGGSHAANAFKEGWSGKNPELEQAIEETMRNHHALTNQYGDLYKAAGTTCGKNYSDAALDAIKKSQDEFGDSAKLLAGATRAGWETSIDDVQNVIEKTMKETGLSAARVGQEFQRVGKNMALGLSDGWTKNINSISDKIIKDMKNIVNGASNAAGVHSPSIYFKKIGSYMVEGLKIGLSEIDEVYDEVVGKTENFIRKGLNDSANANVRLLSNYSNSQQNSRIADDDIKSLARALNNISVNTNVTLEGDAGKLFKAVQNKNNIYKKSMGRSAFA